jgi:hypothetical protein
MRQQNQAMLEMLERRTLLAIQGPVVAQQFIGDVDHITAVVLHFNVPLDPLSAQDVDGYRMVRKFPDDDNNGSGGGLIFGGGSNGSSIDSKRIALSSATYDAAANTVTLRPKNESFKLRKSFTVIVVEGKGTHAIRQADGQILDGNGDGRPGGDLNLRYKARANKVFKFKDIDGDMARLEVSGGGHMLFFLPIKHRSSPSIFLRETTAQTVVSGTVKQGKNGDGVVDIAQLTDNDDAVLAGIIALPNPPFAVRAV